MYHKHFHLLCNENIQIFTRAKYCCFTLDENVYGIHSKKANTYDIAWIANGYIGDIVISFIPEFLKWIFPSLNMVRTIVWN